ncbi:MAG: hypothetical protein Kow00128_02990 [Deltaproteobacteria bacterium]
MSGMAGESPGGPFKVVEVTDVCDTGIEAAVNRLATEGYRFDTIHFVTPPGSRRPSLAFLFFLRPSAAREP